MRVVGKDWQAKLDRPGPVLVIGSDTDTPPLFDEIPDMSDFYFAGYRELGPALARLRPSLVLSALTSREFDVLDLAFRLVELEFKGRYRALARSLPQPTLVIREVRAAVPDLDFDVLILNR